MIDWYLYLKCSDNFVLGNVDKWCQEQFAELHTLMDFPMKPIFHWIFHPCKRRIKVPTKRWKKIIQKSSENGIPNYTAAKTSKLAQAQKTSTEFIEIRYRIWSHSVICIPQVRILSRLNKFHRQSLVISYSALWGTFCTVNIIALYYIPVFIV